MVAHNTINKRPAVRVGYSLKEEGTLEIIAGRVMVIGRKTRCLG